MDAFRQLNINKILCNALDDMGYTEPTPIQEQSFSVQMAGRDVIGIAQTGTGKTLAYILPVLQWITFSEQIHPRVLILVPTRELVQQVVDYTASIAKYMNIRVTGVFGGVNMKRHKAAVLAGCDVLVATPGRLYDLHLSGSLNLKSIKKLVIDEVDVMLDQGFRYQLTNIFEVLPIKRQSVMFSATMTEDVEILIEDFFKSPEKISIAVSGTPLEKIEQKCIPVPNFNTKVNLLEYLLTDKELYHKVLVFISSKRLADRLFEAIEPVFGSQVGIVHSNKSQNFRFKAIANFDKGKVRILVTTEVTARGLDFTHISHVINFDTPAYPENYMHRIGRTGRAEEEGRTLLMFTPKEEAYKEKIEELMNMTIPLIEFPTAVEKSNELIPDERPRLKDKTQTFKHKNNDSKGAAFHDKKDKNKKINLGSPSRFKKVKYKKPKTKGDKNFNRRNKNK